MYKWTRNNTIISRAMGKRMLYRKEIVPKGTQTICMDKRPRLNIESSISLQRNCNCNSYNFHLIDNAAMMVLIWIATTHVIVQVLRHQVLL